MEKHFRAFHQECVGEHKFVAAGTVLRFSAMEQDKSVATPCPLPWLTKTPPLS